VNAELGLLDAGLAERIARTGDEVAAGALSQAGFGGGLVSRILSSGEGTLRRHGRSEEVPARAA
jgi:hypothetical protein